MTGAPEASQGVPAAAPAAPVLDPQAELAKKIDPIFSSFAEGGAMSPGCAVGVYRAGEIVFSKGYGYADLEHEAPITDTTPFYTASLSKQFTAAAVLLLVADGKVSLDDDVRKYVPELPNFGQRITLEHLLHHTSGLRDYHLLLLLQGLNERDVITSREVLWLLSHQRGVNFPPGSHYAYGSTGYVLLAEIVARVSGESFHSFLTRRVFQPLGMTSSLIREDHAKPIPHRAIGYRLDPDQQPRMLMGNLEYGGSSTLVTTTRDLAKWDENFYQPKVGGQAFIDAMRVRGKLTDGKQLKYAGGLFESETHGLPVEEHGGDFAGYRSWLARYPTQRLTVSVLCNTSQANAMGLSDKVAALFLPELSAPEPTPAVVPLEAFGFDLKTISGTYIEPSLAQVRIIDTTDGGIHLLIGNTQGRPQDLIPVGPHDLAVKGRRTHYNYEPAKGQKAARIVKISGGELPQTFIRAEPVEPSELKAEKLSEYTGRYGSDELAHDVEIRLEGSHLVAGPVGGAARSAPFTPIARDLFETDDESLRFSDEAGWRFERNARGKIVRLVVSTDRAWNVVLVRR
ncbi:MAG TPA: serine hydrolase [Polyangiaceae bacterium]|nr:serine hydrolase [Polyangiaceae bacterium]